MTQINISAIEKYIREEFKEARKWELSEYGNNVSPDFENWIVEKTKRAITELIKSLPMEKVSGGGPITDVTTTRDKVIIISFANGFNARVLKDQDWQANALK